MQKLVLASNSPRRRQLLKTLGIDFTAEESGFKEIADDRGAPGQHVQDNALGKARAVSLRYKNALVIGADTVVVYSRRILGKPKNMHEATACLRILQGKTHAVYTGLAVINTKENAVQTDYVKTLVTMRPLNDLEIRSYLSHINPLDKAGAYAIQGAGSIVVERIYGCYYNVVGFPIARLEEMFISFHTSIFEYMKKPGEGAGGKKNKQLDKLRDL
jgi:septum formation protein